MNIYLTSVFGPRIEAVLTSRDLPAVLGRSEEADLCLPDQWVSRVHCVLDCVAGRPVVRDLESRHGTFVNGKKTGKAMLEDGDQLDLGLTSLRVEYARDESATSHSQSSELE